MSGKNTEQDDAIEVIGKNSGPAFASDGINGIDRLTILPKEVLAPIVTYVAEDQSRLAEVHTTFDPKGFLKYNEDTNRFDGISSILDQSPQMQRRLLSDERIRTSFNGYVHDNFYEKRWPITGVTLDEFNEQRSIVDEQLKALKRKFYPTLANEEIRNTDEELKEHFLLEKYLSKFEALSDEWEAKHSFFMGCMTHLSRVNRHIVLLRISNQNPNIGEYKEVHYRGDDLGYVNSELAKISNRLSQNGNNFGNDNSKNQRIINDLRALSRFLRVLPLNTTLDMLTLHQAKFQWLADEYHVRGQRSLFRPYAEISLNLSAVLKSGAIDVERLPMSSTGDRILNLKPLQELLIKFIDDMDQKDEKHSLKIIENCLDAEQRLDNKKKTAPYLMQRSYGLLSSLVNHRRLTDPRLALDPQAKDNVPGRLQILSDTLAYLTKHGYESTELMMALHSREAYRYQSKLKLCTNAILLRATLPKVWRHMDQGDRWAGIFTLRPEYRDNKKTDNVADTTSRGDFYGHIFRAFRRWTQNDSMVPPIKAHDDFMQMLSASLIKVAKLPIDLKEKEQIASEAFKVFRVQSVVDLPEKAHATSQTLSQFAGQVQSDMKGSKKANEIELQAERLAEKFLTLSCLCPRVDESQQLREHFNKSSGKGAKLDESQPLPPKYEFKKWQIQWPVYGKHVIHVSLSSSDMYRVLIQHPNSHVKDFQAVYISAKEIPPEISKKLFERMGMQKNNSDREGNVDQSKKEFQDFEIPRPQNLAKAEKQTETMQTTDAIKVIHQPSGSGICVDPKDFAPELFDPKQLEATIDIHIDTVLHKISKLAKAPFTPDTSASIPLTPEEETNLKTTYWPLWRKKGKTEPDIDPNVRPTQNTDSFDNRNFVLGQRADKNWLVTVRGKSKSIKLRLIKPNQIPDDVTIEAGKPAPKFKPVPSKKVGLSSKKSKSLGG